MNEGLIPNSPLAKLHVELDALGTTIVPGLLLSNATAAALGAQQNSPALMLGGQGWKSGDSTTHPVSMGWYVFPTQGSSSDPKATLSLAQSISGAAPSLAGIYMTSDGNLGIGSTPSNPLEILSVGNNAIFKNSNSRYLAIANGTSSLAMSLFVRNSSSGQYNDLELDASVIKINVSRTNGIVGIGTMNPNAKFDVYSTTTPIFQLSSPSQTNALVFGTNNVLLVTAPTNGVAPPTFVNQPIGLFGSMMMATVTNTLTVGSSGTYYVVSNYTTIRTNGFVAVPSTGYLTNLYAGFYRISYYMSAIPGNADQVELEIFINGTGREEIASFHTYDNPARVDTMNGDGVLYLPANSYVNLAANNRSGANNITIWRCGLTIGTP